ncbi:MAG: hypothetical protein MZV70_68195 [Desulfobacterales bacterium]|nr:hypothetical protein [Desulfobacterales bacterium]
MCGLIVHGYEITPVAKFIHAFLALLILAAAVAPACAGSENCSMPCCRHKRRAVSHHHGPLRTAKPCCPQTADASADTGSGCRFDPARCSPLPS